jgi:hypothetical protein
MRSFTPAHVGADQIILRAVALAYRRARRNALAEGVHFRQSCQNAPNHYPTSNKDHHPDFKWKIGIRMGSRSAPMVAPSAIREIGVESGR